MAYAYACDCLDEVTCDCGRCSLCGELYEDCPCDDGGDRDDDWGGDDDEDPFAPCSGCGCDGDLCVCHICPECGPECSGHCPGCGSTAWLPDDECPDCGWMAGTDAGLVELGADDEIGEDDVPF